MRKTTVTEIATDYGFWELGRFAGTYRSLLENRLGGTPSTPAAQTGGNHRAGVEVVRSA
jgi:AraC family ethanolamine operon transcriptional activator